ncbi:hypothetical protein MOPEL_129_00170 [Mobilicoccus pelagius NBRC 104925]|uniref:Uncharacterized protein n=1 Tax=Mobilicoccus pelagius NBRC 104925 TaxID=1089455 RepID=H5UUG6_9MICO|nr:hypothetical protein MOPEL_129_00170 [Mobilicoccus pelagius NBRC 104925]
MAGLQKRSAPVGDILPWKARPWVPAAIGVVLCALVETLMPRLVLQLPRGGGAVSLAIGHLVPAPLAVALVGVNARTWCSPCRTAREERWEHRVLATLTAFSCLVVAVGGAWSAGWEAGSAFGRGLLTWVALALISQRLLGDQRIWVVPMTVLLVLVMLLGESVTMLTWMSDDLQGRWPWSTALGTWAVAGVASWATPWRLFMLRARIWDAASSR